MALLNPRPSRAMRSRRTIQAAAHGGGAVPPGVSRTQRGAGFHAVSRARPSRNSRSRAVFWLTWLVLVLLGDGRLRAEAAGEYQIKAVFLFNFAQFVDWPPGAFVSPEAPMIIGVLGDDPFRGHLDDAVQGEKVNHRGLLIRRFRRVEEIDVCHVLYISPSENARLDAVMAALKGRSILTVGDSEGFTRRGGMIRFLTERSRIRMRINLEAAKQGGLTISSKLLRPAEIVKSGQD